MNDDEPTQSLRDLADACGLRPSVVLEVLLKNAPGPDALRSLARDISLAKTLNATNLAHRSEWKDAFVGELFRLDNLKPRIKFAVKRSAESFARGNDRYYPIYSHKNILLTFDRWAQRFVGRGEWELTWRINPVYWHRLTEIDGIGVPSATKLHCALLNYCDTLGIK